jgi:hypothetical protein
MSDNAKSVLDGKNLLMSCLIKFYKDKRNRERMLAIINGKARISLRLIDWFITNFARDNNTSIITVIDGSTTQHYNIHTHYRLQLNAFSKQLFDPFRRRERTEVKVGNQIIETTVGQLNFFKWLIQNKILDYIEENYNAIENDMMRSQKEKKEEGRQGSEVDSKTSKTPTKEIGKEKPKGLVKKATTGTRIKANGIRGSSAKDVAKVKPASCNVKSYNGNTTVLFN